MLVKSGYKYVKYKQFALFNWPAELHWNRPSNIRFLSS